jgi:hypothetical protein
MRDRARCRRALATILTASTFACDSLLDTSQDYAELAHVRVTGSSAVPQTLVLSNDFIRNVNDQGQTTIALVSADTQVFRDPCRWGWRALAHQPASRRDLPANRDLGHDTLTVALAAGGGHRGSW